MGVKILLGVKTTAQSPLERPKWVRREVTRFSNRKISSVWRIRRRVVASMRTTAVGQGGEDWSIKKKKSIDETGADSGGSETGDRRLWNVIVLEQRPLFGSTTKVAIRMERSFSVITKEIGGMGGV